jgi:hypothetical protein
MSPLDAKHLGLHNGESVLVGVERQTVNATVALRDSSPAGSVFLEDCIGRDGASALSGGLVQVRRASPSDLPDTDDGGDGAS